MVDYMEQFEAWMVEDGLSAQTIKAYRNALRKLMEWYTQTEGQAFDPVKVTTLHLHEYRAYLNNVEKLDPPTINKLIYGLRTFFRLAIDKRIISFDPSTKVKMKRYTPLNRKPKWMSKFENAKFFNAIEQIFTQDSSGGDSDDEPLPKEFRQARDRAICRLMQGCGLRISEVRDLTDNDISLKEKMEDVIIRNGKGDNYRIVPLNKDVQEAIGKYLVVRGESTSGYFFETTKGKQLKEGAITKLVKKYAEAAGVKHVTPHSLRHTFGKFLADSGVSIERIAYLMGHTTIESTRVYLVPGPEDTRRDVNRISEKRDNE